MKTQPIQNAFSLHPEWRPEKPAGKRKQRLQV